MPEWARQPEKPVYTASEVGALPSSTHIPSTTGELTNDAGFITNLALEDVVYKSVDNVAIGTNSFIGGKNAIAIGQHAFTDLGDNGVTIGTNSHAYEDNAIAIGESVVAEGPSKIGIGNHLRVDFGNLKSITIGSYNLPNFEDPDLFQIANGTSYENASNIHTIKPNGDAWFNGDVYVGSTSGTHKDEGSKKLLTEDDVPSNIIISTWAPANVKTNTM